MSHPSADPWMDLRPLTSWFEIISESTVSLPVRQLAACARKVSHMIGWENNVNVVTRSESQSVQEVRLRFLSVVRQ